MSSRIGDLVQVSTVNFDDVFEKELNAFGASNRITAKDLRTSLLGGGASFSTTDQLKLGTAPDPAGAVTIDASSFTTTALSIKNGATTATITLAAGAVLTIGPALTVQGNSTTGLSFINSTASASTKPYLVGQRSGVSKWGVGSDAADNFVLLDSTLATANMILTNAGAATIRAGLTITAGNFTVSAGNYSLTNAAATTYQVSSTGGTNSLTTTFTAAGNISTTFQANNGTASLTVLSQTNTGTFTVNSNGGTQNISLTGTAVAGPSVNIADGQPTVAERSIFFKTASVNRWQLVTTSGAESGGNFASDFEIRRFDDTGVSLGTVLSINRASGVVNIPNLTGTFSTLTATTANITTTNGTTGTFSSLVRLNTAGAEFQIKEGSNASMGVATLSAGTIVVNNTLITNNTRIFLSPQNNTGTAGFVFISARSVGSSFTISSTSGTDTRTVAWLLIEPAP